MVEKQVMYLSFNGSLQTNDPNYKFFKSTILPSIVTKFRTNDKAITNYYKCPICKSFYKTCEKLKIHLIKRHKHLLPKSISEYFGIQTS